MLLLVIYTHIQLNAVLGTMPNGNNKQRFNACLFSVMYWHGKLSTKFN